MNIELLKSDIHQQIDKLQSEAALREVSQLLASLSDTEVESEGSSNAVNNSSQKADVLFKKVVEQYHGVLQKLAQ